jgi:putative transposase
MPYNPQIHHRRSIRLKGHNYAAPGYYFVTLCVEQRSHLFGKVVSGKMVLSPLGEIVRQEWKKSAEIRSEIEFDEWVIMPNHFHALIQILPSNQDAPAPSRPFQMRARSLSSLMAGFKAASTREINKFRHQEGARVWQRNYYESIVRDADGVVRVRNYIRNNPRNWQMDKFR